MIECPDCGNQIHGRRCSCGYFVKGRVSTPDEKIAIDRARESDDRRRAIEARAWLISRGIVSEDMTRDEWQAATKAYRDRIKRTPKPGHREWAYMIATRIADGETIPPIVERMAKEVIDRAARSDIGD